MAGSFKCFNYAANLSDWIRLASLMNPQTIYLHLSLHEDELYAFPFHLLNATKSSNLKDLTIEFYTGTLSSSSTLASPIYSLRTLSFGNVTFDKNNDIFKDSCSYFPNLEYLEFRCCNNLPIVRHLCCKLFHLKSLIISECPEPNVQEDLEICDSNITNFTYVGNRFSSHSANNISFKGLKCLEVAKICNWWSGKNAFHFSSSLPVEAPQLRSLSLGILTEKDFLFPDSIFSFKCLKHLHLLLDVNNDSSENYFECLPRVLQLAPLLQKFCITLDGDPRPEIQLEEQLQELELLHSTQETRHVHCRIKKIEHKSYCLGRHSVANIVMLLKCVTSLEEMIVETASEESYEEQQKVFSQYFPGVKFVFRKRSY